MISAIKRHATYANVMATIAVFIALGGSAFAVKALKRNSVGTKQLKSKAVTEAKLADAAATAAKLANDAVTQSKLADSAVSKAKIAANAVDGSKILDGSVGISDSNNSLHQKCAANTVYLQGACIETGTRTVNDWATALTTCQIAGGRLPATVELETIFARGGAIAAGGEWTGDLANGAASVTEVLATGLLGELGVASTDAYRCVFDPLA
ncbi:MAG: hypothetical protein QOD60_1286 [Solirubrobacterales bacterium]|jgi:hypothetical protein|nr:hypothetical protein [Solirubrobacterales bacterium]